MINIVPEQASEHVWRFAGRIFNYNSGVIISDNHAWLIDPGMAPDEVMTIRDFCNSHNWELNAVLLTHFHYDHILGVNAFENSIVIAYYLFDQEIKRMASVSQSKVDRLIQNGEMTRPDWSLDVHSDWHVRRQQSFVIGELSVEVIPLPGHTKDQIGVYVNEDRLLWAADTLSDIEIPFISSSARSYQRSLEKVANLNIGIIVPGHGNPSNSQNDSQQRILRDLGYIKELRAMVKEGVRKGLSIDEILAECDAITIWNRDENSTGHRWNIEEIYIEEGGKTTGRNLGWEKEWLPD